jgi:hypothetical protein
VFDGWIAGLGTTSGTRIVLGHWPRSPFGPISDVMLERGDGHRLLVAPVTPPVRFGFGSVPRRPGLVRVTSTVEVRGGPGPGS